MDITPKRFTIKEFLTDKRYKIPVYQRPYSWTKKNQEDLFKDITDNDYEYFIGSVITKKTKDDKVFEIIDGQQRLITTSIFYWLF
ncbi:MAG: DUF262 domain-containing protein [Lactobacillales bacterium]|jgi:uncharacterized protein with ParB-like and HNH nuclease domain|nr:DUF262 domain-containing protein [Lactobacillales bacterium]